MSASEDVYVEVATPNGGLISLRRLDGVRLGLMARSLDDGPTDAELHAELTSLSGQPSELVEPFPPTGAELDQIAQVAGLLGGEDVADDWDATMAGEAHVDVPQWWSETEGCRHEGGCRCGIMTLSEALSAVPRHERGKLVEAQLQLIGELGSHFEAAIALTVAGEAGRICVGCVADPDTHVQALETAMADASFDLARAFADGKFRVRG
jgi:hypothetical protein